MTATLPSATATSGSTKADRPGRRGGRRFPWAPWLLLTPSVVLLAVMVGYPTIKMIVTSFTDEAIRNKMLGTAPNFVGFDNYLEIFTQSDFPAVLARSIALMVILTALITAGGMLLALLMRRLSKGWRTAVSISLLLAWAMPPLAATVVFGWMFDTKYGVANYILNVLTRSNDWTDHQWLYNPFSFFMVLILIVTWQGIPFAAFTFYAGLGQVPDEVLEASQLDGAGGFQRFRFIVMPYLSSVVTAVLVLETIWNLRIFTQVYALQQRGGLVSETNVLPTYIFRQGMGEFGVTAAIGVIMLILLMALSYFNVRRTLKEEAL
ncbi:carbohydrate ABC transporter permease [Agromyces seonyuensis]|uniref:ABC transporter permease subunit n=1 Tax=Agromyces seonyuensis TaxID=2662446 RepID=A0A6I4NWY0_9MICO|nr:sugar ABC transporter permease [Agromyces seonyuensis]MWB98788.1 ABC transporter permease subunit [Agromyces seonyuensis]